MLRARTPAKHTKASDPWGSRPADPIGVSATTIMLPDEASPAVTVRVARGENFFAEGAIVTEVFRLTRGTARLVKLMSDGRRQICEFVMPDEFLGLAGQDEYQFSAEAIEDCVALRYSRTEIEARISADADFAGDIRRRTARRLNNAYDRMVFLSHRSATARVAWFLLTVRLQAASEAEHPDTFHLPMTRSDIGDYLGMALETASRAFTQLKRAGVVLESGAHLVTITDRARLQHIADND
jgi:CRP/FNR family transcriptional regulator